MEPWGGDPLGEDHIGSIDVERAYTAGFKQVRVEYIQGSTGQSASGWCDTSNAPWDRTVGHSERYECKRAAPDGDGQNVCMSGIALTCDSTSPNAGWALDLALGDADWDYAYQSSPNHVVWQSHPGFMVAGWDMTNHANNVQGQDYQVQIWLR